MNRIESFCVDHNTLEPGMYISRVDGDIVTYDLRFCKPNCGAYLDNAPIHTIEHIFATFVRNSEHKDSVIYFGPMGCRTGFYFIVRNMEHDKAIELTKSALRFTADYNDQIPGCSAIECGNYLEHDLFGAKAAASKMYDVLASWTAQDLVY